MDIPKSPHLSKDFSPNGDRIRDSVRARRQQRMQQNRESMRKLSDCRKKDETNVDSNSKAASNESVRLSDIQIGNGETGDKQKIKMDENNGCDDRVTKIRPYGEKGLIINVNGGLLTLNNVKDLDNCSDFDSSCDTSLNYIDLNAPIDSTSLNDNKLMESLKALPDSTVISKLNPSSKLETEIIDVMLPDVSTSVESNAVVSNKSYKSVLEDLKIKLNSCKSKLESLETAGRATISSSRTSMKNYFKAAPPLVHGCATADTRLRNENGGMYSRSSPLSFVANRKSMFEDVAESEKVKSTKSRLFRVNDTPIFERRNVRAISSLFRRSDSDENIPSKLTYKPNGHEAIATAVPPTTFIFNKQKISPTSDLKPNHSFDTIDTTTPSPLDNCRTKRGNFTLKKITNKPEVFHSKASTCPKPKDCNERRTWSTKTNPVTHIDNRRQSKQLYQIESSINTHKSTTRTQQSNGLLSPERIHKLNAKLTESKTKPKSQQPMSNHLAHGNGYLNRIYNRPSTATGHTHHSNLIVHKLPDSTVRRNVSKFDKSTKGCGFESTPL